MSKNDIDRIMNIVNQQSDFSCSLVHENRQLITYTAKKHVRRLGQTMTVDMNFYQGIDQAIFLMSISRGYGGNDRYKVNEILLRMNSVTRNGSFAIWQSTGDIIFKQEFAVESLTSQKLMRTLEYFEDIFVSIKPILETSGKQLGWHPFTSAENKALIGDIEQLFRQIQLALPEL